MAPHAGARQLRRRRLGWLSDGSSETFVHANAPRHGPHPGDRQNEPRGWGKSVHHQQIGEDLGVGYIVEGSVRKDGDRLRVTAQLVDVSLDLAPKFYPVPSSPQRLVYPVGRW
jgi:TolB-like protein